MTGMRRALLAVLAVACLASAAGCGGAVAPRTWVTSVCRALAPWRAQIGTLNQTAQSEMAGAKTPQDTRTHLLTLLSSAEGASEQARAAVAAAGPPDVDGGAEIERRFVRALAGVRDAYHRADQTIVGVSTADATAFYAAVGAAMKQLDTDYSAAGLDTDKLISPELSDDFAQVPACN